MFLIDFTVALWMSTCNSCILTIYIYLYDLNSIENWFSSFYKLNRTEWCRYFSWQFSALRTLERLAQFKWNCLDVCLSNFIIVLTIDLNKIIHSKVTQIITSIFGWQFTHHFHLLLLKCNLRRIYQEIMWEERKNSLTWWWK